MHYNPDLWGKQVGNVLKNSENAAFSFPSLNRVLILFKLSFCLLNTSGYKQILANCLARSSISCSTLFPLSSLKFLKSFLHAITTLPYSGFLGNFPSAIVYVIKFHPLNLHFLFWYKCQFIYIKFLVL